MNMNTTNGGNEASHTSENVYLPDIVKARKAERQQNAEMKRQRDLSSIDNTKSSTGIDPLKQFPKEVWQLIFDQLDPEDRGHVSQVHPVFADILKNNKVRDILFPQVIKIKKFQGRYVGGKYGVQSFGILRSVSKSMRKTIDQWAEDDMKKAIRTPGNIWDEDRLSDIHLYLDYDRPEERAEAKKIVDCFKGNVGKFCFARDVVVCFPRSLLMNVIAAEDGQPLRTFFEEFKDDINSLLTSIGDQILSFCFIMPRKNRLDSSRLIVTLDEIYILLQNWMNLMPRLEWLNLQIQACCRPKNGIPIAPDTIRKYPFPRLTTLERLHIGFDGVFRQLLAQQLFTIVLKANQHVKHLCFENVFDSDLELLPMHLIKPLGLSSFSVKIAKTRQEDFQELLFQTIRHAINCMWKLKSIQLELNDTEAELNDLLKLLHNFPTLEKVWFVFHDGRIGYKENFEYLMLSNLTEFSLITVNPDINYANEANISFFFSLQFLLHCSKLNTLSWAIHCVDDMRLREILKTQELGGKFLDFRAGLRTLYDSNVWDIFQYLDTVNVICRRSHSIDFLPITCSHDYKRDDIKNGMSVGLFQKRHICCRYPNRLRSCVMLYS